MDDSRSGRWTVPCASSLRAIACDHGEMLGYGEMRRDGGSRAGCVVLIEVCSAAPLDIISPS